MLLTGILFIKGTIYGSHKNKYRYLFRSFNSKDPPLLVFTSINRVSELGQIYALVKLTSDAQPGEKYSTGTLIQKLGSTANSIDYHYALTYYYQLNHCLKPKIVTWSSQLDWKNDQSWKNYLTLPTVSIDPSGCVDIDDAFSLQTLPNGDYQLNIDIAFLGDYYSLESLRQQPFTLYYSRQSRFDMLGPDITRQRSLLQGEIRPVLTLETVFNQSLEIVSTRFQLGIIQNKQTITYEQANQLLIEGQWQPLVQLLRTPPFQLSHHSSSQFDSHILIEQLMIFYNRMAMQHWMSQKLPAIVRTGGAEIKTKTECMTSVARAWGFYDREAAKYELIEYSAEKLVPEYYHASLEIINYGHFTSPLRRLVDLYHQYLFLMANDTQQLVGMTESDVTAINQFEIRLKRFERKKLLNQLIDKYPDVIETTVIPYQQIEKSGCTEYECYWPDEKIRVRIKASQIQLNQPTQILLSIMKINGIPKIGGAPLPL